MLPLRLGEPRSAKRCCVRLRRCRVRFFWILCLMLSSVLTRPEGESATVDLLHPEPLADGAEPEERVIVCGISWETYLAFDKALGDDRPGPRLYFLDGDLEIMSTSKEHERIKKWLADLLAVYF